MRPAILLSAPILFFDRVPRGPIAKRATRFYPVSIPRKLSQIVSSSPATFHCYDSVVVVTFADFALYVALPSPRLANDNNWNLKKLVKTNHRR